MSKKMRKCIVCSAEYEYCNRCREHASRPAWMSIYHEENCKNIMDIVSAYAAGYINKTVAKKRLSACSLKNKKNFKESMVKLIDEIYSSKKSTEDTQSIDNSNVEEVIGE